MGTPEFADVCLKSLIGSGHEVAAVFTRKDKPKGRKQTLTPPPVKVTAELNGIPVYQPATLRNGCADETIGGLKPDVIVVAAYGLILPKSILNIPKYGCVNIHASLLPKYRGAAPVQWAVINGDSETGVTSMQMDEGLDTGDMLLSAKTAVLPDETSGELMERLSHIGAELLLKTLSAAEKGALKPVPQNSQESSYAKMLTKDIAVIDWGKTAVEIHNLIRGMVPWPVASSAYQGKKLKIYSSALSGSTDAEPGSVLRVKNKFIVACGENTSIELTQVKPEGGKQMGGRDFLMGHPPGAGESLARKNN